jgi:hypothetical protein
MDSIRSNSNVHGRWYRTHSSLYSRSFRQTTIHQLTPATSTLCEYLLMIHTSKVVILLLSHYLCSLPLLSLLLPLPVLLILVLAIRLLLLLMLLLLLLLFILHSFT